MTGEDEEAPPLGGGRKHSIRELFRDRLLKKPDGSDKVRIEDAERDKGVDDFLKSPSGGDTLPSFPSPYRKPVPRINISPSSRWPSTQEVLQTQRKPLATKEDEGNIPGPEFRRSVKKKKKKRKEGLTVRFADTAPQVIGEGGDEAEAPTSYISQHKHVSSGPAPQQAESDPIPDQFRPRILARAPTGVGDFPKLKRDAEFELTVAHTTVTPAGTSLSSDFLKPSSTGSQHRMREEEGRALTSGLRDPSPEPTIPHQHSGPEPELKATRTAMERAPSHSQRPHNASSDHLSLSLPISRSSSLSSSITHATQPPLQESREYHSTSNLVRKPVSATPQNRTIPQDTTFGPKVAALSDFKPLARRYYPIFALAAESIQQESDIVLSRWIRVATWWFLTAETNFKLLRRDLQQGVDIARIKSSRRFSQAMVDMAKTLWIVEDVVWDYGEKEAIDLSSATAVDRLIQSNPISRFSRTLQYWRDLAKRLDGLVTAVQRSGFMGSTSEEVPLSAGIDSTIWISYSVMDSKISDWLRAANPSWVLMDDTVTPVEPLDLAHLIPLKNTSKIFRMKPLFCHVSGSFRDSHQSDSVPCVLTVGRRSGSYALLLFVASQDHGVNVVLETDPAHGDGMEWQHPDSSVTFSFADGFQVLIQLQQSDYSYFKETYDISLRASTAAEQEAPTMASHSSEQLVFRATCQTFERKSNQRINTFPYEGEQKDCEIFLFEQYGTSEDIATRNHGTHRALRLRVLLSPLSPVLGILDAQIGCDKPILVDAPDKRVPLRVELLEVHRASLVLHFRQKGDLDRFHDVLASPDHNSKETGLVPVPLRSFSVEPSPPAAQQFLGRAHWRQVEIWAQKDRNHAQERSGEFLFSPPINICVSSKEIVIADRIPQGHSQMCWGLSVGSPMSLSVWRSAQQDTRMMLRFGMATTDALVTADQILANLRGKPLVYRYTFTCQPDLHAFQKSLTGAQVLFDGLASSFTTTTRGSGLRSKKDEFGITRLQLLYLEQTQLWHMVAFFEDGSAVVHFVLDTADVFEKSQPGKAKYIIRLVDARLLLTSPSLEDATYDDRREEHIHSEPSKRGLIYLFAADNAQGRDEDTPTAVAAAATAISSDQEKRDVIITFDTEEAQERLVQVLPTAVKKSTSLRGALKLR